MSLLQWIGAGIVAVVAAIDLWLLRKGEANTISARIARLSVRWPIIPFVLGVLAGHLVWPNRGYCP